LFPNLSQLPPDSYKQALFQAARIHPRFAEVILQNGWEQEALDVWLDLARREIALPPAAVRAFLLSGDPRLRQALVHQQSFRPTQTLLMASIWDRDFHADILEATRRFARNIEDLGTRHWRQHLGPSEEVALCWVGIPLLEPERLAETIGFPYPGREAVKDGGGGYDPDRRMFVREDAP
jgi:hypothetical protein